MATAFDPTNANHNPITAENGKLIPQYFDPAANAGGGGFVVLNETNMKEAIQSNSLPAGDNNIGNIDIASAIPTGNNNIGNMDILSLTGTPAIGTEGNAWSAALTGVAGNSASIDLQYVSAVDIFGNVSAATDISVYLSQDNTNFYDSGIVIEISSAENFAVMDLPIGTRYIRLQSSNDVTATATIAAKM